jgi:hypothetical protein
MKKEHSDIKHRLLLLKDKAAVSFAYVTAVLAVFSLLGYLGVGQ